ncbi:hypothetical protein AUEXF2481DRAFT_39683 [Aureobasidium subglaciale EXF-2481]|uniref:Uncharacterized protein n=1 Tax=Aureobasidium subglaciale (strain EXF-2481) TaxID=1043005 RepID=A0A074YDJ3_AURSE|nr:uncharacterized protein AUEXF2481DRAFT_39683 [Aureobasidium subglaciale EXF-2481]KEQ95825.1 hypothetical protein AUEXF2481DRAFT_39683 [Aureobasidium subglaciale EXF-2481]
MQLFSLLPIILLGWTALFGVAYAVNGLSRLFHGIARLLRTAFPDAYGYQHA